MPATYCITVAPSMTSVVQVSASQVPACCNRNCFSLSLGVILSWQTSERIHRVHARHCCLVPVLVGWGYSSGTGETSLYSFLYWKSRESSFAVHHCSKSLCMHANHHQALYQAPYERCHPEVLSDIVGHQSMHCSLAADCELLLSSLAQRRCSQVSFPSDTFSRRRQAVLCARDRNMWSYKRRSKLSVV